MNRLLDQTYLVYKCNSAPFNHGELLETQSHYISKQLSLLLYTTYASTNSDLIPKFRSSDDVLDKLRITSGVSTTLDGFSVAYIRVRVINNLAPPQMYVFMSVDEDRVDQARDTPGKQEFKARLLLKSPLPYELVTQILENVPEMSEPLIIRRLDVSSPCITNVINAISKKALDIGERCGVKTDESFLQAVFGTLDLVYSVPIANDSLRSIQVSVPSTDTGELLKASSEPIVVSLHAWLSKTTKMNFDNLPIKSVVSSIVHLSDDGKIRLCNNTSVSYQIDLISQRRGASAASSDAGGYDLFLLEAVYQGLVSSAY